MRRRVYIILAALSAAIISVQVIAYSYYQQFLNTSTLSTTQISCQNLDSIVSSTNSSDRISVNLLINYGNTTVEWYNKTSIPIDWNFYMVTLYDLNCNIQSTFYPGYGEHLVTGINGVQAAGQYSWAIWQYCQNNNAWIHTNVGADLIKARNGQTVAWAYQGSPTPPLNGARTVTACS